MTTQEHLERIRAKCIELLAIAEKRTAGKWKVGRDRSCSHEVYGIAGRLAEAKQGECNINQSNAAFIASCAGPAEAGWRATIAAIDSVIADDPRYQDMFLLPNENHTTHVH